MATEQVKRAIQDMRAAGMPRKAFRVKVERRQVTSQNWRTGEKFRVTEYGNAIITTFGEHHVREHLAALAERFIVTKTLVGGEWKLTLVAPVPYGQTPGIRIWDVDKQNREMEEVLRRCQD